MKNLYINAALLIALSSTLIACGPDAPSAREVGQQKQIAVENAEANAQIFRSNDTAYVNHKIVSAPDSSQTAECPMGDGWATLVLLNPATGTRTKLKCSTYSMATGCLLDSEFITKPYAPDDGKCQPKKVPFPLERMAK